MRVVDISIVLDDLQKRDKIGSETRSGGAKKPSDPIRLGGALRLYMFLGSSLLRIPRSFG
jgi:hypothetical protein